MPDEFVTEEYEFQPDAEKIKELCHKFEFKNLLLKIDTIFPGNKTQKISEPEILPQVEMVVNMMRHN